MLAERAVANAAVSCGAPRPPAWSRRLVMPRFESLTGGRPRRTDRARPRRRPRCERLGHMRGARKAHKHHARSGEGGYGSAERRNGHRMTDSASPGRSPRPPGMRFITNELPHPERSATWPSCRSTPAHEDRPAAQRVRAAGLARGLRSFPGRRRSRTSSGSPAPGSLARSAASGVPGCADRTAARRRSASLSGPPG